MIKRYGANALKFRDITGLKLSLYGEDTFYCEQANKFFDSFFDDVGRKQSEMEVSLKLITSLFKHGMRMESETLYQDVADIMSKFFNVTVTTDFRRGTMKFNADILIGETFVKGEKSLITYKPSDNECEYTPPVEPVVAPIKKVSGNDMYGMFA